MTGSAPGFGGCSRGLSPSSLASQVIAGRVIVNSVAAPTPTKNVSRNDDMALDVGPGPALGCEHRATASGHTGRRLMIGGLCSCGRASCT